MDLLGLLITLIILGLVFYLVVWFVGWIGLPEPFTMIIKVVIGIFVLVYLLGVLAGGLPPLGAHYWHAYWR